MSQITQDIELIEVAKSAAAAPWDAINAESAARMRAQNKFKTGLGKAMMESQGIFSGNVLTQVGDSEIMGQHGGPLTTNEVMNGLSSDYANPMKPLETFIGEHASLFKDGGSGLQTSFKDIMKNSLNESKSSSNSGIIAGPNGRLAIVETAIEEYVKEMQKNVVEGDNKTKSTIDHQGSIAAAKQLSMVIDDRLSSCLLYTSDAADEP